MFLPFGAYRERFRDKRSIAMNANAAKDSCRRMFTVAGREMCEDRL
jgi:hypothetical protein